MTTAAGESRGRVLVVDDSRVVRLVLAGHLRAAGYHADEAASGEAALRTLAGEAYDVMITDLRMPGLDGFELLAAAKELAPGLEVIIVTGAHAKDVSAAVRALRLGAHDYLTKPPDNADEVVLTVDRALEKKNLRETNLRLLAQLEALSLTDALTGVPNRRSFERDLGQEIARLRRYKHSLGLVMLDIDHFKQVNDTYGHKGGDEVLRCFARIVTGALRKGDSLYRYGGEEFVVILPHADRSGTKVAAERIIGVVAASPVRVGERDVRITTSAGAACLDPASKGDDDLVARADAALYQAKKDGRNRVCVHGGAPAPMPKPTGTADSFG